MTDNERIEFRLTSFHLMSKYMAEMPEIGSPNPGFLFEIRVDDKVQAKTKSVLIFVEIKIFNSQDKSNIVGSLKTVSFFEVIDFDKYIILNEDKKTYTIPIPLQQTIKPVAISTTRGVIYSEFRGTYLHGAVMPVVFMNDFVNIPYDENRTVENSQETS